jgi:hypothetical protein
VFHVHDEPIETGLAHNFSDGRMAKRNPSAEVLFLSQTFLHSKCG